MNTTIKSDKPTEDTPKKKWFVFGTFSLSIFLHLIVLLMAGGIVIIQGVLPKQEFMAEPISDVVSQEISPPEEPSPDMPEQATVESVPEQSASRSEEIITTEPISAQTFNMPSATITTLNANAALSLSPGQGTQSGPTKGGARIMTSLFGIQGENPDGLVGYFYDLKQTPDRKPYPEAYTPGLFDKVVNDFIKKNWDPKVLARFYKVKQPMTAYQICIPQMKADEAPKAFGVEKEVQPRGILVHYTGSIIAPKTGDFRFVGNGDDILYLRFDGRNYFSQAQDLPGKVPLFAGDWIHMVKGQSYSMEVLIGERPGGLFHAFLLIQDKSVEPKMDSATGLPILPVFQTAPTTVPKFPLFPAAQRNPRIAEEPFVCQPAP